MELRPCPFCGSEVTLTYSSHDNMFHFYHKGDLAPQCGAKEPIDFDGYRMGLYQMTCLFQPSLNELLEELALKTGKSKSEMVREATWEYVYKHTAEEAET